MKKRIVSIFCVLTLIFTSFAWMIPVSASETDENSVIIPESDIPLLLWYDEEAPITDTENSPRATAHYGSDKGWEQYSLPIGNGYFGANVFGRTKSERVQITDKTLINWFGKYGSSNDDLREGGVNNFSETYIDFGHENVSDYKRYLDLKTAIAGVEYTSGGVKYTREYFTSYPDRALVIRLDADVNGKLDFVLRPTVPFKQSFMTEAGDGGAKTGTVTSSIDESGVGCIELSGKLESYDIDFLGIYKVYTSGGTVTATTADNKYIDTDGTEHTDKNGTITVSGANSAYIVVTLGTDYELSSDIFTSADKEKPTFSTTLADTRIKVEGYMNAIEEKNSGRSYEDAYARLKTDHITDYDNLFGRVSLDLGCDESDFAKSTDTLLEEYQAADYSTYLELLMFQYGRYLLIASSREGALPANLQGTWNAYESPEWRSGYWHNINVQMNYWPAFSTNLAETFIPYAEFNKAFRVQGKNNADKTIGKYNPELAGTDGGNGWVIGTWCDAFSISNDRSGGNVGFTTQLFWDWYDFTRDESILADVYDVLVEAARFITKCVEVDENGNYLVSYCDSPEVHVNGDWYYTVGTTYAQTFVYLNNYHTLVAAKELGIDLTNKELLSEEEYSILNTVMEQIDKYDPVHVGLSGQIKEFREEDYYGSIGDDPNHRHVSQLVGLYPGNIINATTPAWMDAAKVTLEGRGLNDTGGWVYSHKMGLYARAKDGENARSNLNSLLAKETFPNLFTRLWDIFQIDASFGATAGIAEMLLQSHEGYIEPLAAIPEGWSSGSYTGLVARENFEVSAAWENGVAKTVNILSKDGGRVSVYYPSVTGAAVRDSKGNKVKYTVDGTNLISFDTVSGETYILSCFTEQEKPDAPAALSFTREGFGDFEISWNSVDGAVSYNVYTAVENASTYTLIANTQNTHFSYKPEYYNENARTTFAVTAINESGIESERALCYFNPTDTSAKVDGIFGSVVKSGEMQIIVYGNENSATYRLYEKADESSAYELVDESNFPLLIAKTYNKTSKYAVSVISYYDKSESELYEVTKLASATQLYDPSNILAGKKFVQMEGNSYNPYSQSYDYGCLTDGKIDNSGRFSNASGNKAGATIDLVENYALSELKFYLYQRSTSKMGTNWTVEVYSDGEWVTVADKISNETLVKKNLVSINDTNAGYLLTFNLGGLVGSKIRFEAEVQDANKYPWITFYECECTGLLTSPANEENIFLNKEIVGGAESYDSNYTYSKLNDGSFDSTGRYSSKQYGKFDATIDLEGLYVLNDLKFCLFNRNVSQAGTDFKVQVYSAGKWITVVGPLSNSDLANTDNGYLVSENDTNRGLWLSFDLKGVSASKIKITANCVTGGFITFFECECNGYKSADYSDNLLEGHKFVGKYSVAGSSYSYDKLTDGVINLENQNIGRFSNASGAKAGAEIDLKKNYILSELKFYLYQRSTGKMGTDWTVEVYSDGEWITVIDKVSKETLMKNNLVSINDTDSGYLLTFKLGDITGSKIRFEATPTSSNWITFYECECTGYSYLSSMFEGTDKNVLSGADATVSGGNVSSGSSPLHAIDGNESTYLSVAGGSYSVEFDFGSEKPLYTLRIKEKIADNNLVGGVLTTAANKTSVELYVNGEWVKVISNRSLSSSGEYTVFDLYGVIASKMRITFTNTNEFDGETGYRSAKISEISCTENKVAVIDRAPLADALDKLPFASASEAKIYHSNSSYNKFKAFALDTDLTDAKIETYVTAIENYLAAVSSENISQYMPKTSITLDSNLVMNVYVPKELTESFTLDGIVYSDLSVLSQNVVTLNDGKEYYLMKIELDSYLAARSIKLEVNIYNGDEIVRGTFTLSIIKYAKKVLKSGDEIEKQLISDILSYVRAACIYFAPQNTEAVKEINAIIGENYDVNNPPAEEGSVSESCEGIKAATFVLKSTPSFIFYFEDGVDPLSYSFKANGKDVSFSVKSDINGTYAEISLYAYSMCETVTYYIDGVETGSYHIASYYEWSKTQNDETLSNLVERFWKYCQSAREYKNAQP